MTFGKPQAIAPDPAMPGGYSLLVAAGFTEGTTIPADPPEQSTPALWVGGVEWAPEQVQGGGATSVECIGDTPAGLDGVSDANVAINQAFPILIRAADVCSTFQSQSRDRTGRARRELVAVQSQFLAAELQKGAIRTADSLDNVALIDGQVVDAGSTDVLETFAALEQITSEAYGGRRAMFYMAPIVLTFLVSSHVLTLTGQKWVSPMGNVVASDGGFTDEDSEYFIYASLVPTIRLGDIIITPETEAEATDRSVNLVTYTAQRLAIVTFDATNDDPADLIFKASISVPVPTIGS